ncbi:sensor domain-containing diguanylate cyclase [Aliarcobacter cryaerophilus]|uniref:diguanylate cyclase n=1 Tax=Aliarcobacter cryaerophilus TaxID=28198 RepID=A0A2S9TEU4_9BACT|nr:diguanylate cyclase [Aliarcobacter cryaerophilus]PRM97345.1 GGDEF domain-containing protein [Arcobacter cryaerophilus gv. crypticus]
MQKKINFMEKVFNKEKTLKATVLSLFISIMILLLIIFGIQLLYIDNNQSKKDISEKFKNLSHSLNELIKNSDNQNFRIVEMLSIINHEDKIDQDKNFETYIKVLNIQKNFYSVYTGYEDGSFYELINLNINKKLKDAYKARELDRWVLIKIDGNNINKKEVTLYDEDLNQTAKRVEENSYNPTKRPWYEMAISSENRAIKTVPYKFSHIDSYGLTFSKELNGSKNVVSVDFLIEDFKNIFKDSINQETMDMFLFKKDGTIISSIAKDDYLLATFFEKNKDLEKFENASIVNIKDKKYIVQIAKLNNSDNNDYIILFADYKKTVAPYLFQTLNLILSLFIVCLIMIPLIIYFSKIIVYPILKLVRESKKIKNRKYDSISKVDSSILEVSILSNAFLDMSKSIYEYQQSLEEKVEQRTKELNIKNEELFKLSITDKLTGIYNRVKLDNVLQENMSLSLRYGNIFSVIIIDIDFFKKINDNFGHQVGDDVLKECSNILSQNIRNVDTLGRWGGEEFLVVCPETLKNGAKDLAIKLNKAIKLHKFSTYPNSVTISVGVATCSLNDLKYDDIISNADKALYEAKNNGRDRVEVF